MYVIETDAECTRCGSQHGVVTKACDLVAFTDWRSARYVSQFIEGSVVREIDEVPDGFSYTLYAHQNGRPDPNAPRTETQLPRG